MEGSIGGEMAIRRVNVKISAVMMALVMTAFGCGSGGSGSSPGKSVSGTNSTLSVSKAVAASTECPYGGVEVDSGIDVNANGILDDGEVTTRQNVCNGADGNSILTAMVDEPAGDACEEGGIRINVGADTNDDGTLEDSEITSHDFVCNGETGPVGPAGPGVSWEDVTGTSVQAQPNKGYIVDNDSRVTVRLPSSPSFGDIVEVNGIGSGGWMITQNSGQKIITSKIKPSPEVWTPRLTDQVRSWFGVASSADGNKLAAVMGNILQGFIYTSNDSGVTWTARVTDKNRAWRAIASSSDGGKLVAVVSGGQIYTSNDSGVTWTARATDNNRTWVSVASSADGNNLTAVVFGGQIYRSNDSGVTWTAQATDQNRKWTAVASSADGKKLAAVEYDGNIYMSTDSGATWTARATDQNRSWNAVTSSSDGSKLAAEVWGGQIYTSIDSGVTWTAREQNRTWNAVASSADGSKLVAVVQYGQVYTSIDSGVTWTERTTDQNRNWCSVASSSDGSKLVAVVNGGQIYTSRAGSIPETKAGTTVYQILDKPFEVTNGFISGEQYDSIRLQFIGNNRFTVLDYLGDDLVIQ
jgi:photosystem II stability/assembly factor-like uncharacterized protein